MKTMLASLLVSDANVLMLDEPTNFLDLAAVEALEGLLKDYPGTVVFVSHDRRLIEEVATRIFHIHEERIEAFEGTYEAYKQKEEKPAVTNREEELLLIDMQLSEVLSRLSIEPSQELEETFQALLKQKSLWSHKRKPCLLYRGFSARTNPRILCQSCVPVLTNVQFAPLQYSSFLDFKGFPSR